MKFFLQLILPLLCLIYGTSMIKDEWEEGSLVFLFSTSTSRVILFLGKFWINLVFLLCFLWSGFLLANLAFFLFYGWNWHDQMPLLFYFGKAILLGVVFYLSFFVCLGFFLSKPFIGGVLCIILEYTLLLFPKFAIQKITPIYYLQNIIEIQEISFLKGFSELALNFQKNWNPLASSSAFLYLGMAFLIFLLIGIFQFQRLEAGSHKNSI